MILAGPPIRRVAILGANSGIGEATARIWAREGASLLLAGRDAAALERIAGELLDMGGAAARIMVCDVVAESAADGVSRIERALGGVDDFVFAVGAWREQADVEREPFLMREVAEINFTTPARWVLEIAGYLEKRGKGSVVVVGSVSGDRGRRRNHAYAAAKAGLAVLVEGIAHRFALRLPAGGPRAVIVKPGPAGISQAGTPRGFLTSSPDRIASVIRRAADRGGPVQYAPWWWRPVMAAVRLLPWAAMRRLDF